MIEANETKPVEASLTIVLRGKDIHEFKFMINAVATGISDGYTTRVAENIREALS